MNIGIDECSAEELTSGFRLDEKTGRYTCIRCGTVFEEGEIYPFGDRFYDARRALKRHIEQEHPDRLRFLLDSDSKYLTLTDNQKELMRMFYEGKTDKEIADELGVSASTVRHQKFMFREKAKQAKLYLALYELGMGGAAGGEQIVPIHEGAKMVDDRYLTTKSEQDKILAAAFESLSPLRLKALSPKEKKKLVILSKIAEQFERGKQYPEKQINEKLKSVYDDYVTLRRYLIEYGFMDRKKDCSVYWLR